MKLLPRVLILIAVSSALSGCYADCSNTDDEVIRKAVEFFLEERQVGGGSLSADDYASNARFLRYDNFEDFTKENPDCCKLAELLPEYSRVPLHHRVFYGFRGVVHISYPLQVVSQEASVSSEQPSESGLTFEASIPVNSCGEPLLFLLDN